MALKWSFTAAGVALGLSILWAVVVALARPSEEARWINSLYKEKAAAVRHANPQVFLVGGSATHFSFSASIVGNATGLRVVNFGAHAGLGARYILYRARQALKPGDTVVISLEYSLLYHDAPSQVLVGYVLFFDRAYLLRASVPDALRLMFGLGPIGLLKSEVLRMLPRKGGLYRPGTVSELGDEPAGSADAVDAATRESVRSAAPIAIWPTTPDEPPAALAEFAEWSRQHHVKVLAVWPPIVRNETYALPQYAEFFASVRSLYESLGISVVGTPEHYFLPADDMLDTIYHADLRGQRLASERLAQDLCNLLTCAKMGASSAGQR
jgi:hypothetical protein